MEENCLGLVLHARMTDGCKTPGGIESVAVAIHTGGTGMISFQANANGYITGVTNSATTTFYNQAQHAKKATFSIDQDESEDHLSGGWTATGTVWFKKNDHLLRKHVVDLTNAKTFAIVKTNDSKYILIGETFGTYFTASVGYGQNFNDPNGTTCTFNCEERFHPRYIDPVVAESLINYDFVLTDPV